MIHNAILQANLIICEQIIKISSEKVIDLRDDSPPSQMDRWIDGSPMWSSNYKIAMGFVIKL